MVRKKGQRSGVLLLRAWIEEGTPDGLRVRVIKVEQAGEPSAMVAGTVEATCTIVANWLRDLVSADPARSAT